MDTTKEAIMSWQEELKNNVTTIEELAKYIPFESSEIEKLESIVKDFPMSIPRYYLSLIDPNDPNDPIRKKIGRASCRERV